MLYRGIKILSTLGIILSIVAILFIQINSAFILRTNASFDEIGYVLVSQAVLPILSIIVSVALRLLYNELSSDKVSTITMMTDMQKELDTTKQELAEVKQALEQLKSK